MTTPTLYAVPGRTGGKGYIHAPGIKCGHRHGTCGNNRQQVTCPACIRKMEAGAEAQFPKPRKPKPSTLFRLWNRRTGTWASDTKHQDGTAVIKERLARIRAAALNVQPLARASLLVTTEGDVEYIVRRQAAFDTSNPHLAAKRLHEFPDRTIDGIRAQLQPDRK